MVPRRQRVLPGVLVAGVTAGAVLSISRCFVAGPGGKQTPATGDVMERREFLSGALAGSLGLAGALANQNSASADFLQPFDPKLQNYKSQFDTYTPDQYQKKLEAEFGNNLGRVQQLKNMCIETDNKGKVAQVGTDTLIVWDPSSGECPDGQVFIHAAGRGKFVPMTAAKGANRHSYMAATFEEDWKQFKDKLGQCVPEPKGYEYAISWQIANSERGGKCTFD
eukprot:TRINITY_DN8216_c0_g1_i2.p1 TRINITY_DN8216_c0_g1~~TRINITY_DN8216_c0_g1_i2.p1  ORF type:complete len:223 (+),score=58.58 TRINITY_DN8216_c0_g1_i2:160-828(+)